MSNTRKRRHPLLDITMEADKIALFCDDAEHNIDPTTEVLRGLLSAARSVDTENPLRVSRLLFLQRPQQQQRQQKQQHSTSKWGRSSGLPLTFRLAMIDILRFAHKHNPRITAYNINKFLDMDVDRNAIAKWERDYDKIRFHVQHGRGSKCKLSSSEDDVVLHYVNESVFQWLKRMREKGNPVSGRQFSMAANDFYHVLVDSCSPEFRRLGRECAFTASWRTSMKSQYRITYCKLKGQAGSVDVSNPDFKRRMNEINEICSNYDLDDIFNCDETGMYLTDLSDCSYTTVAQTSGVKPKRGVRVSILFCINASGSSLLRSQHEIALRPFVLSKHLPKDIQELPRDQMTAVKHESGYMNSSLFLEWLHTLDSELTRPSLLILDSYSAHTGIDKGDSATKQPWKHIRIERLPLNSTSITQPLDKGVISVFKRRYLEILSDQIISKSYGSGTAIRNGKAWSLIPYAWSHIKESTLRHCFRAARVLPPKKLEQLETLDLCPPLEEVERQPLWPAEQASDAPRMEGMYLRLIASVLDGDQVRFKRDDEQRDEQELATDVIRQLREKMAQKGTIWNVRERSSSLEPDEVETYKSFTQGETQGSPGQIMMTSHK